MFLGCLSVCPILMNVISQEYLEEISSKLAQMSTWTRANLLDFDGHCELTPIPFL